jgi:pSer/pThr/pTyr-binding forkhead associated (FHA) protein
MQFVTSASDCYVEDLNSTNGVFLNGKRVRRHKLQPGDVIKLGMHDLTYLRADLPAAEDTRVTQTQVLQPSDYEDEDEAEADERNDGDRDGPNYSSIARGS